MDDWLPSPKFGDMRTFEGRAGLAERRTMRFTHSPTQIHSRSGPRRPSHRALVTVKDILAKSAACAAEACVSTSSAKPIRVDRHWQVSSAICLELRQVPSD